MSFSGGGCRSDNPSDIAARGFVTKTVGEWRKTTKKQSPLNNHYEAYAVMLEEL